jgi:acetolactate synthase-1/2/3 large subunit
MELETAVRLKANVLHLIWVDNGYNMVAIQETSQAPMAQGRATPMVCWPLEIIT